MKKKYVAMMMAFMMLIFSLETFVANESIDDCSNHNLEGLTILDANEENVDDGIAPCYNTVCGSYSYHRMVSSGFGFVDNPDGSSYLIAACAWQCSRCKLVIVTEGDLYYWGMDIIGKYATYRAQETINSNGCYIRRADSYGYTDKNYLDGYKFYLSE